MKDMQLHVCQISVELMLKSANINGWDVAACIVTISTSQYDMNLYLYVLTKDFIDQCGNSQCCHVQLIVCIQVHYV